MPGSGSPTRSIILLALCALLSPFAAAQDTKSNEGGDLLIAGYGTNPGEFLELRDIAFDARGTLYALDGVRIDPATKRPDGNLRIQKFSRDGKLLRAIDLRDASTGETLGDKNDPQRLAADAAGNVYVTQPAAGRVQRFGPDGKFLHSYAIPHAMAITRWNRNNRERIAVVPSARVVVNGKWTWVGGDRLLVLGDNGSVQETIPLDRALENVIDAAGAPDGSIYLKAEPNAIYQFSPAGKFVRMLGGNPTRRAEDGSEVLHTVAVDSRGNVYTMTWGNPGVVTRFDADSATVTQRPGQFKWANPWSEHSSYVPLAVDGDDRLWAAAIIRRNPATDVHYKTRPITPAIIRTRTDFFQNPASEVRITPTRILGFKASLKCDLPQSIAYAPNQPVTMRYVVAPAQRAVRGVTVKWRAFDAVKTEIAAGQLDLPLVDGEEAGANFTFTPPGYSAYFVLAEAVAPQGPIGGVGAHVGVTPRYLGSDVLADGDSSGGWVDISRQMWTGLPNVRIHPGKDDKSLEKTDAEIARAEKGGVTFLVQLVDNMKDLTPEHVRRVALRYKGRVKYYEVCNEPNFTSKVDDYFAGHSMAYRIIKEIDPGAQVMGPATVNLDLKWLDRLYQLGFKDVSDIVSLHDYEGHESITPEHWRWKLGEVRRIMAAHGDAAKPIWQTERAIAGVRGDSFQGLVQAIRCTLHRDLLETLGIPSEHNNHYYLNQAGYGAVPSYVWSQTGPHPAALALRTRHALTTALKRRFAGTLDFGPTGNTCLLGVRYAADDGRQTVVLRNLGSRPIPVDFEIKGASSIDCIDAWGNESRIAVSAGKLRVNVDQLPTYLRLEPGTTLAASRIDFGNNIAPQARWNYSSKVDRGDFALLTNGILETYHSQNPNGDTNGAKIWTGDLPADPSGAIPPQTLEATFDAPQSISRVIIRGVRADNTFCAPLEYDLDAFDGAAWKMIEAVRRPMPSSERAATADAKGAIWMDDTNFFIHEFAPIRIQRLRIVVRRVSNGLIPDRKTAPWGPAIPSKLMLREVEIYAAPNPSAALPAAESALTLSTDGQAAFPIIVGSNASQATRALARDLADMLGRISGATFTVQEGDGARGIVLGRPADFTRLPFAVEFGAGPLDREDYLLRSRPGALYLLGATDLALSHAAWDLLHRLGYRQFFPGKTWEIIPRNPTLRIAVDTRQRPAFHARRIWYNWGLWGYNDEPYRQWCARNRMAKGFDLNSGHSYESIIDANRAEFEKHPEYLALVKGERKLRGDVKFCVSNPGLRKLVAEHALRHFRRNPSADSISMDPSDGGNWCECAECAAMGSVSNRVVTLANAVAEAINTLGLGPKYVGIYAYNQHSAPPTIKVHPNVIPSATTAFIGGGLTFDQVVRGWQAQGATMGVYDYLSVVDWDWNLPRNSSGARPADLVRFLPRIHAMGARYYDAESGDCWGPCGLGYYTASRVLWDLGEAEQLDSIVNDFLERCFGEAREPMRQFYELINRDTQRRSPSDIVGRMYRHLDAARRLTTNPAILARLDDLLLYTRHAELYYAHGAGRVPVEEVARHAYRMRKTMMVHSYGLWARLLSQKAAHTPNHPLKSEATFAPAELAQILSQGIASNQPVEMGFTGISFSQKLVPAAPLALPKVPPGRFPGEAQDRQSYYVWLPQGANSLDLQVTIKKVWATRMPKVSLFSPQEVSLNAVAVDESPRPDGQMRTVRLRTPYAGLHRVETLDGGDFTRIAWPEGLPVTLESGIDTPGVTSHFRGSWTLYFYVPRGTRTIGGWASRIANWAPRISGKLLDPDGSEVLDFGKCDDGWFNVPVPPGQDGRLWRFADSQGQRLLMTVPPYLARTAEELLLPSEVVEADQKR